MELHRRDLKILFVYHYYPSFVKNDYLILKKNFDVLGIHHKSKKDILRVVKGVLKTDLSFSWFANGHAAVAVFFSKLFRKKSIVVVGGEEVEDVPEIYGGLRNSKLSKHYTKFVLNHADLILCVSNYKMERVLAYTKCNNIKVIYSGVAEKFKPGKEKNKIVITTAISISESYIKRKGLEAFVKAAKLLSDIEFVIIGKYNETSFDYLRSIASSNVTFTGYLSDEELVDSYERAKVYAQLSYHEAFGLALAEAMACECVPVVTNNAALPEVVGDTGLYVPYGDPEATAEAVKMALNMDGRKARERVERMFLIEKREKELVDVIKELIAS